MSAIEAKPLWPQPIEIIGLTGEYQSGKTTFGLSVAPGPDTRMYDFEKSGASYTSLGFDRVDVPREMLKKYPTGYKPLDLFQWWLADVRSVEPGRYRVIMVDPATDVERGLVDWVSANPSFFGHTTGQYASMSGIMWGDVKDYWKSIIGDLAARCETFVFTAHLGEEFKDKKPTGKRKPKGKDTLAELCSLYLWMERKKDATGKIAAKPSAVVLKSRLSFARIDAAGDVDMRPALPPRIPVATPKAIREYLVTPPDYENLKEEERATDDILTPEEMLRLELSVAEAKRDAANAQLELSTGKKPSSPVAGGNNNSPESHTANYLVGIRQATTKEALQSLAAEIKTAHESKWITDPQRDEILAAYKARGQELKAAATPAETAPPVAAAGTNGEPSHAAGAAMFLSMRSMISNGTTPALFAAATAELKRNKDRITSDEYAQLKVLHAAQKERLASDPKSAG